MRITDLFRLTTRAVYLQRLRSSLTILGIGIGIAAVVVLTSIGEGLHQFVLAEFSQFGTNLLGVNPGKTTTHGASVGVFGTVRPLTLDDAEALRHAHSVDAIVPVVMGNAEVKTENRTRRVTIYGVGPELPRAFRMQVKSGRFLPEDDPSAARNFVVLGSKVRDELFGNSNPLGESLRLSGSRFRIIGTMESKGQILGFDMDDTVYIPVSRAMEIFNREGLFEIDVLYREGSSEARVVEDVKRILEARHGREDFTITTQQQMLDTLSSVLNVLTFAVAAIGGISLLVGGIGILTIMTISVKERTVEIGLLRALGATRRHVLNLFLGESILLASTGGVLGLATGFVGAQLLHAAVPALPVHTPWSYAVAAVVLSMLIGLLAGVVPSQRAARLDPIEALRTE
jgi:putative ABC transport system permease protein